MSNLISIVITIYNIENDIYHSLDAVCDQTYKNIELILVNDGSSDNSVNAAEKYLKEKKIKYSLINQLNSGPSAARNVGIQSAKGNWILTLDGDDYILPQTIETMVRVANENNVKCVFCDYKSVNDLTLKADTKHDDGIDIISDMRLRKLFFQRKLVPISPGMLLHRSVYEIIQYDEDCRYCEDTLFLWELFYKLNKFVFIKSDLYNYYHRENSTMHSLKPEKYLSSSPRHLASAKKILAAHPLDRVANMIYPKFRLAGLRIICRNNSYNEFIRTVATDGGNAYIRNLFGQSNPKLFIYALIFIVSKRLFYQISK